MHDVERTDGERVSVDYPVRAAQTEKHRYSRNYDPQRWLAGDPEYNYLKTNNLKKLELNSKL